MAMILSPRTSLSARPPGTGFNGCRMAAISSSGKPPECGPMKLLAIADDQNAESGFAKAKCLLQ